MNALENDVVKKEESERSSPWKQLLGSRALLYRFAACSWCWVAVAFVYYGLTINSVTLSGDKYVNFALTMSMEIVASLLIMMALERFGRKWSIFTAFCICGVACVTPFFICEFAFDFLL
jgi:MFS transporter, OCT family, solute carrier family 22 (organic cation transporter), member 4/5